MLSAVDRNGPSDGTITGDPSTERANTILDAPASAHKVPALSPGSCVDSVENATLCYHRDCAAAAESERDSSEIDRLYIIPTYMMSVAHRVTHPCASPYRQIPDAEISDADQEVTQPARVEQNRTFTVASGIAQSEECRAGHRARPTQRSFFAVLV